MKPQINTLLSASGDEFLRLLEKILPAAVGMDHLWLLDTSVAAPVIILATGNTAGLPGKAPDDPLLAAVATGRALLLHRHARRSFPASVLLAEAESESLLGEPLHNSRGERVGALVLTGRQPLRRRQHAVELVRLCASRAASELEQHRVMEDLRQQGWLYQTVLNALPNPIFFKDHKGIYLGCNRAFEEFLGLPREKIIGQSVFGVAPPELAEVYYRADQELLREGGTQVYEAAVAAADGQEREVLFQKAVFYRENGEKAGLLGIMTDIGDRKQAERTIEYLGNFDRLTQLPNQLLFTDRLNHQISHCHRLETSFGICCLDLDQFKRVNNVFGHAAGDRMLKEVASRLRACLEEDDTLARMGGDSFTMILTQAVSEERAKLFVRRILESFTAPFEVAGQEIHVTASLGLALYPYDGTDGQALLKNADNALHRAKEKGGGGYQFFAMAMNRRVEEQMLLENHLRQALEAGSFELVYQPQVGAMDGGVVGAEALLRWRHPAFGLVGPERFIPLAEQIGLIHELGSWVLRRALAQLRAWDHAGLPPLRMSVNLSARQFQRSDLSSQLSGMLREAGVDPGRLSLEITESVVMRDVDHAVETLYRLKDLGVHLAIDDFGTGYSSLNYLRRFPIDQLKIDRSFILDIPERKEDQAVVEAILALARALDLRVLAEGVEREEQRRFLVDRGCHELQGYLFGHPVPGDDFLHSAGTRLT